MKSYKFLTTRDMNVLKTLYYNRFMSTDQIRRLFYNTKEDGTETLYGDIVTRRRLKKLRDHRLIKSYHRADCKDMLHIVDHDGLFIVASMLNTTWSQLYYSNKKDLLAYGFAEHSLMITEVYIKLLEETKKNNGEIELFQVEKLNEKRFELDGTPYKFRPDAFMIYRPEKSENRVRLYFLEVDNSTESPIIFKSKISQYEAYYKSNLFQQEYSGLFPEVIVICRDQNRIDRLENMTKTFLKWRYILFDESEKMLYN